MEPGGCPDGMYDQSIFNWYFLGFLGYFSISVGKKNRTKEEKKIILNVFSFHYLGGAGQQI